MQVWHTCLGPSGVKAVSPVAVGIYRYRKGSIRYQLQLTVSFLKAKLAVSHNRECRNVHFDPGYRLAGDFPAPREVPEAVPEVQVQVLIFLAFFAHPLLRSFTLVQLRDQHRLLRWLGKFIIGQTAVQPRREVKPTSRASWFSLVAMCSSILTRTSPKAVQPRRVPQLYLHGAEGRLQDETRRG